MKKIYFLLIIELFLAVGWLRAETTPSVFEPKLPPADLKSVPLQAFAKLQKSTITVNETTRFELELVLKAEHEVLPFYVGPALKELRVINSGEQETPSPLDKTIRKKYWFEIEPVIEGQYLIPAIKISYKIKNDPQARVFESASTGIFLQVGADPDAAKNMEEFLDNASVAPVYWTRTKLIILSLVGVLLALAGGVFVWWRRQKNRLVQQAKIILPPWEIAQQNLLRLKPHLSNASDLSDRLFCFEISEIFRRYLDGIYDWNTLEKTTEEIRPLLRQSDFFPQQELGASQSFLLRTDEIKFTSMALHEQERLQFYAFIENFIKTTKPNLDSQKLERNP